jgi:uroporphyrinogen-III synthase
MRWPATSNWVTDGDAGPGIPKGSTGVTRQIIWITRTAPGCDRTARAVHDAGFEPVIAPLLVADPAFHPPAVASNLDDVAALAFTSVNGLAFADLTPRRDWPVFAVGARTAEAARARGFTDVVSADGAATDLADLIARQWRARPGVLLAPAAARPAADLAALLEGRVPVRSLAVYNTLESPEPLPDAFDVVLIHSPRAAETLARRLSPGAASGRVAIALSPAVATPLQGLGFAEIRIAARPDEHALMQVLGKAPPAV